MESSNCQPWLGSDDNFDARLLLCAQGQGSATCKVKPPLKNSYLRASGQGDSGGPLTVADLEGRHKIAGIVSRKLSGDDCDKVINGI